MANRYWVGGTGTWNTTNTANWSATSGGAGGATVPTIDDDVFINNGSSTAAFTITANTAGIICNNLTVSGLNGALTFTTGTTGNTINVSGNLSFPSTGNRVNNMTAGEFNFRPKKLVGGINTIDLGGTSLFNVFFYNQSAAGDRPPDGTYGWSLTSNFNATGTVTHNGGSLSLNNINFNAVAITNTATAYKRSIDFGSATITLSSTANSVIGTISTTTNLTSFNCGTSTLKLTGATVAFLPTNSTFYNVEFNNSAQTAITIGSSGTFNNLTFAPRASVGISTVTLTNGITLTVNNLLSINSGNANAKTRIAIVSSTVGTPATINATNKTISDADFRDITATQNLSGTRLGDCGGNTNITFDASKTVYLNTPTGGDWSVLNWSSTIGGATNDAYYPLPQDQALLDDVGLNANATISSASLYNMPALRNGARTLNLTFSVSASNLCFYGAPRWPSNWTPSGSGFRFFSRVGNTINLFISNAFGSFILEGGGSFNLLTNQLSAFDTRAVTIAWGKLILNGFKLYIGRLFANSALYKEIDWSVSGSEIISNVTTTATPILTTTTTNTTFTGENKIWRVTGALASGSTLTIASAAFSESNAIDFYISNGLTGSTITLSGNFGKLDFTGCSSTIPNWAGTIYGDINLGNATFSAGANTWTLGSTSSTIRTITSNGKTLDFPVIINGVNGYYKLLDNFTIGTTRQFTLTNGSFDLNGKTASLNTFTNSTGIKILIINGGKLFVNGSGATAFNNIAPINFLIVDSAKSGSIIMSSASAKTFVGGGSFYPCAVVQGGLGTLTITGNNTIETLSNSAQPSTILFAAGATNTINNFNINGTSGSLVTIGSTTTSQTTIKKRGSWILTNSVDGGNNTRLIFSAGGSNNYISASYINGLVISPSNFFCFF